MGADDIMAILYLLQRPDVQVKAITVAGTGLARCTAGVRHAQGLVAYEQATLQVVMEEGPAYGTLQRSDGGSPVQVAVSANGRRFEALFLQTLNAP